MSFSSFSSSDEGKNRRGAVGGRRVVSLDFILLARSVNTRTTYSTNERAYIYNTTASAKPWEGEHTDTDTHTRRDARLSQPQTR